MLQTSTDIRLRLRFLTLAEFAQTSQMLGTRALVGVASLVGGALAEHQPIDTVRRTGVRQCENDRATSA